MFESVRSATLQEPAPPPAGRPRLGFIGVGWIGRHRLDAIVRSGLADIVAICDPAREAALKAATLAPDAAIVDEPAELLDLDLDGVVIATPSASHAALAIEALQRKKAVFCQKPLARNHEETERVIAVAHEMDRLLHLDLSYRFTTGMQHIYELIHRGALGRIYAIEGVFHNAYGPDKPWFYDPELSGGGCLLDLGIHLVDLALWCLDFPAVGNVTGHLLRCGGGSADDTCNVEHYAATQFFLETGASVQLACSWKAPAGCDAKISLTFFGTEGGASFANVGGSFYDFTAEYLQHDCSRRLLAAPPEDWGGRAAIAWTRRLAESPSFDSEIKNVNHVAHTLDRIYGRIP